jgi:hypothetical protein
MSEGGFRRQPPSTFLYGLPSAAFSEAGRFYQFGFRADMSG